MLFPGHFHCPFPGPLNLFLPSHFSPLHCPSHHSVPESPFVQKIIATMVTESP